MKYQKTLLAALLACSTQGFAFTHSGIGGPAVDTGYTIRGGAPVVITQSTDTATITPLNSVACPADDDAYLRRFDLDGDHGITGPINVTDVDFGVETSTGNGGPAGLTINLYSVANGDATTYANMTLVGTAPVSAMDGPTYIINAPVAGTVDGSTDDLVVEIFAPDFTNATTFFVGSNPNGQTGPTLLSSPGCGAAEPTDIASLGFPGMHMIMVVNGTLPPMDSDLSLSAANDAIPPVSAGSTVNWTMTASNIGAADATNVVMTSTMSDNLTYVTASCVPAAAVNVVGQDVTFTMADIAAAGNAVCTIATTVSGFDVLSVDSVISADNDPTTGNNAASSSTLGPARIIPTLSWFGMMMLVLGMVIVARRL